MLGALGGLGGVGGFGGPQVSEVGFCTWAILLQASCCDVFPKIQKWRFGGATNQLSHKETLVAWIYKG